MRTLRCPTLCTLTHSITMFSGHVYSEMSHVVHSNTFHNYVFWPCILGDVTHCALLTHSMTMFSGQVHSKVSHTFHGYVFWTCALRGFPSCALWHIPWLCFPTMCTLRFSLRLQVTSQYKHLYGFSPVWVRICLRMSFLAFHRLSQSEHW